MAARASSTTGRCACGPTPTIERQERISYADTSAALTALKREPETAWLNEVSSVPPQQALRHLDRAFRNFFEGQRQVPGLQEEARAAGGGVHDLGLPLGRGEAQPDAGEDGRAARPFVWSRAFTGAPTTVTVTRDPAGRYFVSFLVEEEITPLPATAAVDRAGHGCLGAGDALDG